MQKVKEHVTLARQNLANRIRDNYQRSITLSHDAYVIDDIMEFVKLRSEFMGFAPTHRQHLDIMEMLVDRAEGKVVPYRPNGFITLGMRELTPEERKAGCKRIVERMRALTGRGLDKDNSYSWVRILFPANSVEDWLFGIEAMHAFLNIGTCEFITKDLPPPVN